MAPARAARCLRRGTFMGSGGSGSRLGALATLGSGAPRVGGKSCRKRRKIRMARRLIKSFSNRATIPRIPSVICAKMKAAASSATPKRSKHKALISLPAKEWARAALWPAWAAPPLKASLPRLCKGALVP